MISPGIHILTDDDLSTVKQREYARGVERGKFEANTPGASGTAREAPSQSSDIVSVPPSPERAALGETVGAVELHARVLAAEYAVDIDSLRARLAQARPGGMTEVSQAELEFLRRCPAAFEQPGSAAAAVGAGDVGSHPEKSVVAIHSSASSPAAPSAPAQALLPCPWCGVPREGLSAGLPYASWDDVLDACTKAHIAGDDRGMSAGRLEYEFARAELIVLYRVDMPESGVLMGMIARQADTIGEKQRELDRMAAEIERLTRKLSDAEDTITYLRGCPSEDEIRATERAEAAEAQLAALSKVVEAAKRAVDPDIGDEIGLVEALDALASVPQPTNKET